MKRLLGLLVITAVLLPACGDTEQPSPANSTLLTPIHRARDAAGKQEQRHQELQDEIHRQ